MNKNTNKRLLILAAICGVAILVLVYYFFFTGMSKSNQTEYVYIDADDTVDSVYAKVGDVANSHGNCCFRTLIRHSSYADNIRTGRYAIAPGEGAFVVFRHLKNGMQTPLNLTIPCVRTIDRLAGYLGEKLMMDSLDVLDALTDSNTCQQYGYDTATVICMFIPNTYSVYWNIATDKLLEKMKTECERFWNNERTQKAASMNLKPTEVMTLASIVDEETANDREKPMIAGMYFNRLKTGMPLQADPTVKFALKQFELKRIWNNLLQVNSPYNTYRNIGLPPGPIRIPTVAGIDAVLNHVDHDYLYMCAKEDFSGTHNFARTYAEHLQNAAKYSKALNERGIQ
jgi:UPF0755 protein